MELQDIRKALKILESSPEFASLIPEVRSNLVMSKLSPRGIEDVAGIPGRITVINQKPKHVQHQNMVLPHTWPD